MTTKRKAELQRKLSLRSVPRPPDDLLERIKADIPNYLTVEAERQRFSRSIGFHLKIAASVLILVTSLLGVLFLFAPGEVERAKSASPMAMQRGASADAAPQTVDTVQVEIAQETATTAGSAAPAMNAAPVMQLADADVAASGRLSAAPASPRRELAFSDVGPDMMVNAMTTEPAATGSVEGGVAGGTAGGVIGGVVGGTVRAPQSVVAEAAPPPAAAPEPPLAAPVPPPPSAGVEETARQRAAATTTVTASAPSIVSYAYASSFDLHPKSVFGLSIDPEVFRRIKNTIERGGRVPPSSVNVEALVNYFAGAPERRVRSGVRMEVEGSPAPVEAEGNRGVVRVSIDTAAVAVMEGGSVPPIAKDAKLEIEFNPDAVSDFKAIGDNFTSTPESVLLHNLSVTGLYAVDLHAPLKARDVVATIRLHYRNVSDNKKQSIVRVLHGSDFAKQWTNSSRRHRLASLGALWGESLRSTQGGTAVARRAEELASDEPDSERARELAAVANASSGGGSR
jgi:hypothetical protein